MALICTALVCLALIGGNADAGVLFAGTLRDGVFRSDDAGDSWTWVGPGLEDVQVYSLVLGEDGHLLAGTDDDGVFRWSDGTGQWEFYGSGLQGTVRRIVRRPDGHLFAATSSGLYESGNNAESWQLTGYDEDVDVVHLAADGTLYIGTELEGTFRSSNGGTTWIHLLDPGAMTMSLLGDASGRVFAGSGVIFRSPDMGETWTALEDGPFGEYVLTLAFGPSGDIFAGTAAFDEGPHRLYRSADGGDSWTDISGNLTHAVFTIAFDTDGNMFVGTFSLDAEEDPAGLGGVHRSSDGGDTWVETGLTGVDVVALVPQEEGETAVEPATWGQIKQPAP